MSQLAALRQAASVSPENLPLQMLYAQACLDEFALGQIERPTTSFAEVGQMREVSFKSIRPPGTF